MFGTEHEARGEGGKRAFFLDVSKYCYLCREPASRELEKKESQNRNRSLLEMEKCKISRQLQVLRLRGLRGRQCRNKT